MDVPIYIAGTPDGEGARQRLREAVTVAARGWAERQMARTKAAFRAGGHQARGGSRWRPWSRDYAEYAESRGRSTILVDTGMMRRSLTYRIGENLLGTVIWFGSPTPYFSRHQYGEGVPQRKIFEYTPTDMRDLRERVNDSVRRTIGGA